MDDVHNDGDERFRMQDSLALTGVRQLDDPGDGLS